MSDMSASITKALKLLLRIRGNLVWFVRMDFEGILRMDFGSPHLRIREPTSQSGSSQAVIDALEKRMITPEGRWHLFIDEADWHINTKYYACGKSDDPNLKNVHRTLRQFDGQRLMEVRVLDDCDGHILEFDLGGSIELKYPIGKDENANMWILFTRSSGSFSLTCDGKLLREGSRRT